MFVPKRWCIVLVVVFYCVGRGASPFFFLVGIVKTTCIKRCRFDWYDFIGTIDDDDDDQDGGA